MPKPAVIIPVDARQSGLGLPSCIDHVIDSHTVLSHTLRRVQRVAEAETILLVHPPDQRLDALLSADVRSERLRFVSSERFEDPFAAMRQVARRWSPTAWRGGLGAMSIFDELLPPGPLLDAMDAAHVESALLVGPDWCCVDPGLCDAVLKRHLVEPSALRFVFTQAAPGLCGCAVHRDMLDELQKPGAAFAELLNYVPTRPQLDPIGRDVCIAVPPAVRDAGQRYVYDLPQSRALLDRLVPLVDADTWAETLVGLTTAEPALREITIELTPYRLANGFVTPHHHCAFDRDPMSRRMAMHLIRQLEQRSDVCVTFGGLGDAMLHPDWHDIARAAKDAGVLSVHLETDMLIDPFDVHPLIDGCVDVVSLRLNADTAESYAQAMGVDRFGDVLKRIEQVLNTRNARAREGKATFGVPWLVPRFVKTADTLHDMDSFFDKWTHFANHAVIEPPTRGRDGDGEFILPQLAVVDMSPPKRYPCRQIQQRMTVLSNGFYALCDQDWTCAAPLGDAHDITLDEAWDELQFVRQKHAEQKWDRFPLCEGCREWHRP